MYEKIIAGVIAGVGYSIIGWKKTVDKDKKTKFEWLKLGQSVAICGIVGGFSGYTGQEFGILITGMVGVGVTKLVNSIWKIIFNFIKKRN